MPLQLVQKRPDGTFGHPVGHPGGVQISNHEVLFTQWPAILKILGPGPWINLYATVGHHLLEKDKTYSKPQRTANTFQYQSILAFDIDHCDVTRAYEYAGVVANILQVEPSDLTLVVTGNGVHVYAHLKTAIRSVKFMGELKPAYNELCLKMEKEIVRRGLPLDKAIGGKVDPVIFDVARILRVPNTINRKEGKPDRECLLLQYSPVVHDLDLMVLSGLDKIQKENISPEQIRRQYPKPDFEEMVKECRFVSQAMEKPEDVHEPQAFAIIGLMAAQDPSSKVVYHDREVTGRQLAEAIFRAATNSPSLAAADFDRKWEDSSRYGAQKCSTISGHSTACQVCPHNNRIPTPLALKSPEHVGSEALGYWVMNSKGGHSYPNYGDLARVYQRERSFLVTEEGRLFNFHSKVYEESSKLEVKSWLERKVTPPDPIREAHRSEFVAKISAVGCVSKGTENDLFTKSIVGKINCANGILDIVRGEMIPHAPQYGFQYVLPYDYSPGMSSELFLDWLAVITENRTELMDAILDMMAYCLWPTYDDHVFFCLIGVGANGKSTLLHIIQAMLGKGNFSAVSMQQLGSNRFAPANLEGKLANLSEESSGYELNYEELNVLQNLSAGGEMEVERKGVQGFTFKNKAKLIFSANKPPRFKDTGHAIRRRMVAIPFDHMITTPDTNIEANLIADVPAIVSMLIRRIQDNTNRNAGRFKVARGGEAAAEKQKELLLNGNSVVEWSKEILDSSSELPESAYISVSEGYQRYKMWCEENTYKPVNKGLFSHLMYSFVISSLVDQIDNRIRVDGKQVRVFKRTKWKEEE